MIQNVLSVFDGIACARVALDRSGIKFNKYYSSEVDRYAITVSKNNYPDIIHLGDIREIKKLDSIDLLIGGSPCQGFSFAGKQLNFDDPRSALFFEYVRVLKLVKPKYFILENVRMKQEFQDVISNQLGVEPVMINSALVSAQNRQRLYWANFPISQPKDKGLLLKDIIEQGLPSDGNLKQYLGEEKEKKSLCIRSGIADLNGHDFLKRVYSINGKCPTLTAVCGGNQERKIYIDDKTWRSLTPIECERLQTLPDNYTEGISKTQRYKALGNGFTVDVIAHILRSIK